ncbi:MAG: CoA-binding protein [Bacteroidota bacterium]
MKADKTAIDAFFSAKKIAIAGVSRDTNKFGHSVFNALTERGFDIYPINPNTNSLGGIPCFQRVRDLPSDVVNLLILTPKAQTSGIIEEAIRKGITNIWIQQMSETPEAVKIAQNHGVKLVYGQCILMWADPVKGFHKFHKSIKKLFGLLPG